MTEDPNIIQSLSRGLEALELVAQRSMTPKALASALGVDRSTAYRILCTLAAHGFVERDPLSEQYIVSSRKVFALSSTISADSNWPTLATPWLKQLRDELGEAVSIAILQGDEVVYVNHLPSLEAITVGSLMGLRRPVYVSAVGKAIIAFLPAAECEDLIDRLRLKPMTSHTITSREALRAELAQVRRQGFAVDNEETFLGVRCVAAPLYDHTNQVIASMGLSGPASRVTSERLAEIGARVRTLAHEFSLSLGARRDL
ncbi:MAG: IclR family transcriptional regulator [Chloroflexi bacterium]|nr:IclR family transcriptional regulator [Chloroflexota bacterium]